jgi:hypothetical protein
MNIESIGRLVKSQSSRVHVLANGLPYEGSVEKNVLTLRSVDCDRFNGMRLDLDTLEFDPVVRTGPKQQKIAAAMLGTDSWFMFTLRDDAAMCVIVLTYDPRTRTLKPST